ncbi:MAG: SDR family NAD(P)-dependent oxidoreductase [Cellvibrionaceae bacterium]
MKKTILLTGATDGIGFETAKIFAAQGHNLLLHGRSESKLDNVKEALVKLNKNVSIELFQADLSDLLAVEQLVLSITKNHSSIDVLINNAGVFKTPKAITDDGYDIRFMVNTIAPYLLTQRLLPLLHQQGRVINLSSAAQAPVSFDALRGQQSLNDSEAYAQSKLAITMWTYQLATFLSANAPSLVAVNPASFLGSKMVKEAYGSDGKDLSIGADVLVRAALDNEFANIKGRYFDNDIGNWSQPHPDALDESKNKKLITVIDEVIKQLGIDLI